MIDVRSVHGVFQFKRFLCKVVSSYLEVSNCIIKVWLGLVAAWTLESVSSILLNELQSLSNTMYKKYKKQQMDITLSIRPQSVLILWIVRHLMKEVDAQTMVTIVISLE
jgi:hypothetical protein